MMRTFKALRAAVLAAGIAIGLIVALASGASAAGIKICIPEKEGASIVTAKAGVCKAKYTASTLLPQAEQQKLEQVLPYVKYESEGIDSKPTIQVTGANVQIMSGAGKEAEVNGEGNLVIGYNESPGVERGSNNVVLGTEQEYGSFGSLIAGKKNRDELGEYSDVFGESNEVFGPFASSVTGGQDNQAGAWASVSGGQGNRAYGWHSWIGGGVGGSTPGADSTVSGGEKNVAEGNTSSVSGGLENEAGIAHAETEFQSVSGGRKNRAGGSYSSVSGGEGNRAEGEDSSVAGGKGNLVEAELGSVFGGYSNLISPTGGYSAILGGHENNVTGEDADVGGGRGNTVSGKYASLLGGDGLTESKEYGVNP